MSYFNGFPTIDYKFGNLVENTKFQKISTYVDMIDQLKDNASFYNKYYIIDGDRPDNVSFKLYNTTEFYWTFYILNDSLRRSGWPLRYNTLLTKMQKEYPHTTLVTTDDISSSFLPGSTVTGVSSGATGTIYRRRLNFGQIVVKGDSNFRIGELITTTEGDVTSNVTISEVSSQYNALHHFEDVDGNYVDVIPYQQEVAELTRVTFLDRAVAHNEELKGIKVLKPEVASNVFTEIKQVLRSS